MAHDVPLARRFPVAMTAIGFFLILQSVLIFECAWAHPFLQDSIGERTRIGTVYSNRHFEYQVLESMWNSQLYELASQHCQAQQRNYAPGSDPLALWTLWELEGLYRQASEDRTKLTECFEQAQLISERFLKETKNEKRRPWIEFQHTQGRWLRARTLVADYLAAPANTEIRDQALEQLRSTLEQTESMKPILADRVAEAMGQSSAEKQSWIRELQVLTNELILLEIECFDLRAQCYPPGSTDRLAAASQMKKVIDDAVLRIGGNDEARPKLETARVQSHYLSQQYPQAITLAKELWSKSNQDNLRAQLASLAIMASCEAEDLKTAEEWIERAGSWKTSPYLAIAKLEYLLTQLRLKNRGKSGEELPGSAVQECVDFKNLIGTNFGRYWLQRSEALIVNRILPSNSKTTPDSSDTKGDVSLQLIRTQAKQLLAASKWQEAIAELEKAKGSAIESGQDQAAFQLGLEIGALYNRFERPIDAYQSFTSIAESLPKNPQASEVHLLGCWTLAKAIEAMGKASSLEPAAAKEAESNYRTSLQRHLEQWSNQKSALSARRWLDERLLRDDDLPGAAKLWVDALPIILNDSASLSSLVSRIAFSTFPYRSYQSSKEDSYDTQPFDEQAAQLESTLKAKRDSTSSLHLERLVAMRRLAAILQSDARWLNNSSSALSSQTTSPSNNSTASEDLWTRTVNQCSNLLAAMENPESFVDEAQVDSVISTLSNTEEMKSLAWPIALAMWERIDRLPVVGVSANEARKKWSVGLTKLRPLLAIEQPSTKLASIFKVRSQILDLRLSAWKGDSDKSQAGFEELLKSQPKNLLVIFEQAQFFREQGKEGLQKALQSYRRVANGSKAGSELWLEARLRSAYCLKDLGQATEAKQIIDLVIASYPKLPAPWAKRISEFR